MQLVSIVSALCAIQLSTAAPLPIIDSGCDLQCRTDNILFQIPLGDFLKAKAARDPAGLDWTDDGCSKAPDRPLGYNFLDSCKRHDFGYRNFKGQKRFTEDNRAKVDQRLKDDLYAECRKYSGLKSVKGVECRRIADVYYAAVRKYGGADVRIPKLPLM